MGIQFTSLNSGSNGNCYYVGNDQEAVLIDAGISCRETERRMARLGLSMHKVKAIFVSHEHSDHIRGVAVLARKYQLPVYITPATLQNCYLRTEVIETMSFQAEEPVQIGDLTITAFSKWHDAADPHSFVVACGDYKIGVFTDIGRSCQNLMHHFSQCHAAFLEANYCEHLLENGRYPYYLKNRIRGGRGHLSNREALALFTSCKPAFMHHVLLSHLSKENNCPNLVKELFEAQAENTQVTVAGRYEETPVFTLHLEAAAV
jgi:phosphoribosyl 1,2-cyclic phosphodiesterase